MHAAVIHEAGGEFELEEREIPTPDSNEVRIAVDACGICHSDEFVKAGTYPGISYPRIPGHEIAGRIDAVGDGVSQWSTDDRVGVGWHGGHCFTCEACRRGDFKMCDNVETTGVTYDAATPSTSPCQPKPSLRFPTRLMRSTLHRCFVRA